MKTKDRKLITRLLVMQINAHVDGDTKHSDKILSVYEVMYGLSHIITNYAHLIQVSK